MIGICTDETFPISRQPNGNALCVHCTGGLRGFEATGDRWGIEPILDNGYPCSKGFFTKKGFQQFARDTCFTPIALHFVAWIDGDYHSSWSPLFPGRQKGPLSPSDLWSCIAHNLSKDRSGALLRGMKAPSHDKIAEILDDRGHEERLAQSISLSLRSMDISVEQISEHYNEQLVNLLTCGKTSGERVSTSLDQVLFAHVHSFFMHFGAARDYLAALIATRIGKDPKRIDNMSRLIKNLRSQHFRSENILELLKTRKLIHSSPTNRNQWEMSGWLKEASDLRNVFVHRRPYGSKTMERVGWAVPVRPEVGLYRYFRPVIIEEGPERKIERDVLDVVVEIYKAAMILFQQVCNVSSYDASILTLTDKDLISLKVTNP